jgi:hypothetical protein
MRQGRFNTSRSSTRHGGRYTVKRSYWCAQRVHAALRGFPHEKAVLHRKPWLATRVVYREQSVGNRYYRELHGSVFGNTAVLPRYYGIAVYCGIPRKTAVNIIPFTAV